TTTRLGFARKFCETVGQFITCKSLNHLLSTYELVTARVRNVGYKQRSDILIFFFLQVAWINLEVYRYF
ncbi:MAG: hypothetical protein MJK14_06025, partial [Rivularia sp. ALOHA_DT_140]|nr:hypothetical protein [Rivularia sp. ALOHA_DT_140]